LYRHFIWMHDLSARAAACEPLVRLLARLHDATVVIAHALGPVLAAPTSHAPDADPGLRQHARMAAERLGAAHDRLVEAGIPTAIAVREGQPVTLAQDLAVAHGDALVVIGPTGQGGLDRVLLLGSEAERLVRRLSAPVLVGHRPVDRILRIVCAVDADEPSVPALVQARALARRTGAELDLITVVDARLHLSHPEPPEARLERAIAVALNDATPFGNLRAVHAPSAFAGLQHVAPACDLLVVGTRGRRGLRRLLLGSTAEAAIRKLDVTVLVAR
jgi:nucleotide-binding universal stress UspA family protein